MLTMSAMLRNRNFALLWIGQLVSLAGDYTFGVALAFYVLQLTGSVLQTGSMFIIETLPAIFLGSLAGVFVDRWDRRWTMIISNLLQAGVLLLLLLVRSPQLIWLVYIVTLIQAVVSLFFSPAVRALTPTLVEEKQLLTANSLESFNDSVTRLVGPPLGGALLAFSGLTSVVFVDAGSFLFAAFTLLLIIAPARQVAITTEDTDTRVVLEGKNVWREWLDGLRLVRTSRILTAIFVVFGVSLLGQGFVAVMFVVYVKVVLHGNGFVFGLMPMAQGVGALLGTFLVGQAHKRIRPGYIIAFCLTMIGGATLIFVQTLIVPLVIFFVALIGVFVVGSYVTTQTLLQVHTTDSYRGRVFGALGTTNSLTLVVGMLFAALLGSQFGAVTFLSWSGILYILSGVVALVLLRKTP